MTETEARDYIQEIKSNYPPENYTLLGKALYEAVCLLEKQIPKQPIIGSWESALCPSCGEELSEHEGDGYYKHYYSLKTCECGQKLNWV